MFSRSIFPTPLKKGEKEKNQKIHHFNSLPLFRNTKHFYIMEQIVD